MQDVLTTTTAGMAEWIKAYKISELEKKENLTFRTIKKRNYDYIPVIFENWHSKAQAKAWYQKRDYSIKYIRRKDVEKFIKWK